MGFSFNWNGVTVPHANVECNAAVQNRSRSDGAAWGQAARGYVTRKGQQEYADMIANAQHESDPRIMEIEAEIAKLEARNNELQQLQAASQQAQQQAQIQTQTMAPQYAAQQQMQGYSAYLQGMHDQAAQAGPILTMLADNYRRTR